MPISQQLPAGPPPAEWDSEHPDEALNAAFDEACKPVEAEAATEEARTTSSSRAAGATPSKAAGPPPAIPITMPSTSNMVEPPLPPLMLLFESPEVWSEKGMGEGEDDGWCKGKEKCKATEVQLNTPIVVYNGTEKLGLYRPIVDRRSHPY